MGFAGIEGIQYAQKMDQSNCLRNCRMRGSLCAHDDVHSFSRPRPAQHDDVSVLYVRRTAIAGTFDAALTFVCQPESKSAESARSGLARFVLSGKDTLYCVHDQQG